jgi:hypothetical protein
MGILNNCNENRRVCGAISGGASGGRSKELHSPVKSLSFFSRPPRRKHKQNVNMIYFLMYPNSIRIL